MTRPPPRSPPFPSRPLSRSPPSRPFGALPWGWPRSAPAGGEFSIPVASGDSVSGRDFGSYQKASISGTVFHDKDADGAAGSGEGGLGGRTVYIDADSSGDLSAGDPTTSTDANGDWSFTGLDPGSYDVRTVEPDASWHCSAPAGCHHAVTLSSGQSDSGVAFGQYQDVSISGAQVDVQNSDGA